MGFKLLPRGLRYVELVARLGSIQAASRDSGIAASAIDRQILMLEEACDAQLFERQPGGMRATAAGEAFVVLARRWRSDEDRLWSEIKQMQGVEVGHVRMAAMDSQVNGSLPTLLERLAREHPRITLEIEIVSPDEAVRAIQDGAADLAFAFNAPAQRDLHVLWTADLPMGCIVAPGHPLASSGEVTLKDVARHPIVAQSAALSIRRYFDRRHPWVFAEGGAALATNSLQLLKEAVAKNGYLALTSELDAAPELISGALIFVPIRERSLRCQSISVVINARRPFSRAAKLVAEALGATADEVLQAVRARRGVGA